MISGKMFLLPSKTSKNFLFFTSCNCRFALRNRNYLFRYNLIPTYSPGQPRVRALLGQMWPVACLRWNNRVFKDVPLTSILHAEGRNTKIGENTFLSHPGGSGMNKKLVVTPTNT